MDKDTAPTKDDVARLIRGKPSQGRVGSRQIRHRLRKDELERLAVARSRGYLSITATTRTALRNAWYLDRLATSAPCLFVEHMEAGYSVSGEIRGKPVSEVVRSLEEVHGLLRS